MCIPTSLYNCDEQGGETALMAAAENGHHACISILVANGADVNMASKVPMEMICIVSCAMGLIFFFFECLCLFAVLSSMEKQL